jgi:hypothetical protein
VTLACLAARGQWPSHDDACRAVPGQGEEVIRQLRLRPVRIRRTGDDTPARSLYGYVWRMSGWHQAWLALLAALVAGLSMAPLELQRRIVNNAIGGEDLGLLALLAAVYLAVVVLQTGLKYLLRLGQGWVGESAIRYTSGTFWGSTRAVAPALTAMTRQAATKGGERAAAPSRSSAPRSSSSAASSAKRWPSRW